MIKRLKILFLKWQIKILLHKYHLARNPIGSGRRKKFDPFIIATGIEEKIEADYKLFDQISKEERDERNKTK